jgi:hypothetical protein
MKKTIRINMPSNDPNPDYKKDLEIDKDNLHLEWARLPGLFSKWGERLVDAQNQRDRIRDRMELKAAELDADIRANPEKYNVNSEKKTERQIKSAIIQNQEYKALQEQYLDLKRAVGILKIGCIRGLKGKEKAIDRMTKLYHDSYWCESNNRKQTSRSPEEATSDAQEILDASMKSRFNRK